MDPKLLSIAIPVGTGIAGLVIGYVAGRISNTAGSVADDAGDSEEGDGIELYVGNLSYDIGDKELMKAFAPHGKVLSARIIKNKFNNRSKGYGFVEVATSTTADKAVKAMHGKELKGRKLVVNEARSRSRD
jgi:RNA recognition motif-containing protein